MSKLDKLTKINDICLFVENFQDSLQFYIEKFKFKLKRLQPDTQNPNYAEFDFHGSGVTLWDINGLYKVLDKKYVEGIGHKFMIAVKVPELQDVDDIYRELVSNGVSCLAEPTTYEFGSRAVYLSDLEGNIWEIFAWEEGNGPGLI